MSDTVKINRASGRATEYWKRLGFAFPYFAVGYTCAIVDGTIIASSSILACSVLEAFSNTDVDASDAFFLAGIIAAALYVCMAHAAGLYRAVTISSGKKIYRKILSRWVTDTLLLSVLAFFLKDRATF